MKTATMKTTAMNLKETPTKSHCVICGETSVLALNERRPGLDVVVCKACGLVWNRLMREEKAQEQFYRETNRSSRRISHRYLVTRVLRAACILDFLEGDLKPGLRHLDVGCAEGTLLTLTRARGLEVMDLELDSWHAPFAREVRGLAVHSTTLEDAPLAAESLDLVSFVHVLEHLFDPIRTLNRARDLLAEGGLLYVEVPNLNQPLPGLRRFFRHQHNFYFTANTLRALVSAAGFVPLRVGVSPRDASVQLLARKGEVKPAPTYSIWRDDPARIQAHITNDRPRHYLMLPLLLRRLHQERLKGQAVRRFGAAFAELQADRKSSSVSNVSTVETPKIELQNYPQTKHDLAVQEENP